MRMNGFNFKVYERFFAGTRTLLIGDPLVKTFNIEECDVVIIARGRWKTLFCYLRSNNLDSDFYVFIVYVKRYKPVDLELQSALTIQRMR